MDVILPTTTDCPMTTPDCTTTLTFVMVAMSDNEDPMALKMPFNPILEAIVVIVPLERGEDISLPPVTVNV